MKMSEFTTKSFLGNAGAAENSYILINYEDNSTSRPVTYKASLQEIGKAIANDQKLYKKTQNGAVTTDVSQGAYINGTAEVFASTGAVAAAVSGLASTGYVDTAVANAGGNDGFTNDGDIPVYVGASDGDLKWYNWANSADCTPYNVISTNGKYLVAYDENENTFGYFADVSDAQMTPLSLGGETDLHGYVQAASSLPGQYRLQFQEEGENGPIDVTPEMIGAASTGDLSGLASTGYVANEIADLTSTGYVANAIKTALDGPGQVSVITGGGLQYYNDLGSIASVTYDMISGAASTGYVTSATADMVTINYLMASQKIKEEFLPGYSNLASKTYVDTAISNGISGLASTGYVTEAMYDLASQGYVNDAISGLASTGDLNSVPVQYYTNIFSVNGDYYAMIYESEYTKLLLLGESDNRPCIRDQEGVFQGFFSAT